MSHIHPTVSAGARPLTTVATVPFEVRSVSPYFSFPALTHVSWVTSQNRCLRVVSMTDVPRAVLMVRS